MMDQHIFDEQITYYRKRAQEYDETTGQTEDLQRALLNGQTFLIVKVFYDLQIIENLLDALDFTVTVQKLDDIFFFLQARRKAS